MDNSGYSKVLDRTPRLGQKWIVLDSTGYSKVLDIVQGAMCVGRDEQ